MPPDISSAVRSVGTAMSAVRALPPRAPRSILEMRCSTAPSAGGDATGRFQLEAVLAESTLSG